MNNKISYWFRILNSYVFYKKTSNLSFWHTKLEVNELTEEDKTSVKRYPMNFGAKTRYNAYKDQDGIIMLNYYGKLGLQYNPNAIAQQALGFCDLYLDTKDEKYKDNFLTQANFFLKQGRLVKDGVLLWEYNFPFEMRNHLTAPWRSALAQGQALSVLIRAHQMTGDNRFLERAHAGYKAFHYVAREHEGGVLDEKDGYIWLEEYIVNPPNHVLNGFIWTLWGIRDYAVYFNDAHAKKLYQDCLNTLEKHLEKYDLGFWTAYDWPQGSDAQLPIMPASIYYQRLHAVQMRACYNLFQRDIFKEYALKWEQYLNSYWNRLRSQVWKAYFKVRYF